MYYRYFAIRCVALLALAGAGMVVAAPWAAAATTSPVYPLKASANGRYLVDQAGTPTMLVGDSPHSLFANITTKQAGTYFSNRAALGFNAAWIEILCNTYAGGRADGSTYDGIVPFTTPGNLATPNPAYFARVDQMIQIAAQNGITVLLDAFDTGGWMSVLQANGPAKALAFGKYLGTRYKNFPNIIWITGNDFQTWQNATDNANIAAIMAGIAATDPNHLQTSQLSYYVSGSLDDALLTPYTSVAGAYTYYPTYAEVLDQYNAPNFRPTIMEEANYEFENNNGWDVGDPLTLRRQEYWTMLSGAAGQMYGNHYTWTFATGWQTHLNTPGAWQLKWMRNFFQRWQWWSLVPDQQHTVVTAGYGTFATSGSIQSNNYVTTARLPDGSLVLAYCPTGTTLTVNMSKLKGRAKAQWFDPSTSTMTTIAGSPLANTGQRQFTTPGTNGDGHQDWVLVLSTS